MFDVGNRIRQLRKEKGVTTTQLAQHLDVAQSFISRIENNTKKCSLENLDKICSFLGVSFAEFFSCDDPNLSFAPLDITQFSLDKNNQALIRLIQSMKNYGYSNEVISEWIQSMHSSLIELGKKYGAAPDKDRGF